MVHSPHIHANFAALDVGAKRVGVAVANVHARLARPLTTVANDEKVWETLADICHQETVGTLVVGLPRGLDGQETDQTRYCRAFADEAEQRLGLPVSLQDEALTSYAAETELKDKGLPADRGDVDALAATYILEDYLKEHHGTRA